MSEFSGWCSVEYELVADNYFIVLAPCGCGGDPECSCANGMAVVDEVDLGPLLQGLAVAGALTRAHRLGKYVWSEGGWSPNVNGKAAP